MEDYIFVEEKSKKIVDEKGWRHAPEKAVGYAEALSKQFKKKIITYVKVAYQ